MRVLILGGSGMLGHRAFQELSRDHECYATFRSSTGPWRRYPFYRDRTRILCGVDALDFESIIGAFAKIRPEAVINCVGIIKQLKEAKMPITSLRVNALFPQRLVELCALAGARLVHVSTDCVFSGRKGGYREDDFSDAEDLYGRTKLLGEVIADDCLTIRTSIVGWDILKFDSLLEWFYGQRGKSVKGYANAVFSGLSTQALASTINRVLTDHPELSGLYHVSSAPIDKFRLLTMIKDALSLDVAVERCEEPRIDRSLDSTRFQTATGLGPPEWPQMIDNLVHERVAYDRWRESHAHLDG